ncbi:MAG: aspartyl protease family protein [Bacteroidaceae bacterium]|mgnify:CR=1 FL=1|nr:aspartyl protease family protein [Bacteroidaceae bacterium]
MGVYTKQYDTRVKKLTSECSIYPTFDLDTIKALPKGFKSINAVWDTGADLTCIHPRIVKELGLEPYGQIEIEGYGGVEIDNTYAVHLKLPTNDWVFCVEASASENLKSFDIVIGMDVIGHGDFCFTNKDDKSCFSFRIPSTEHIILK